MAEASFGDACCRKCSLEAPAYARAVNYGAYTGALRQLVHLLKYDRVRAAAAPLARWTAEACLQLEGDIDIPELLLIPVPAHKVRLRARCFNQAELIARAARRNIEQAIRRRVVLDANAMLRVRFFDSQVALTAEERHRQIRGSFKVVARERVKGREVLLVDDVLTTGATASECARELLQAGAARVWVVTPARTVVDDLRVDDARADDARIESGSFEEIGAGMPGISGRSEVSSATFSRLLGACELGGVTVASPESRFTSVSSLVNRLSAPEGFLRFSGNSPRVCPR